jgi:membrane-bound inhibitor of C-type lysozyme
MKNIKITLLVTILILLMSVGCQRKSIESISAIVGKEYIYLCTDGSIVKARFGELSDKSLSFVKIKMDNGKEYTLPQLVSASGARYSDERELEFWIKGDRVTISKMNENGEWKVEKKGETKEE